MVAEVDSTIVLFNYEASKPAPVPADARAVIGKLEGKVFPNREGAAQA